MSASINQRLRHTAGALAVAVALLAPAVARALPLEGLPAAAAPTTSAVDPDLCAVAGSIDLPGAPGTPIWGFALKPDAQTACSSLSPQLPGPVLEFATGDNVTLNVTNALPGNRTLSITIPGLSLDAGPTDAGPGDTVALHFTAGAPGTYLYSSVGDAGDGGRQTAMGLYGALLVCSSTPCPSAGSDYGSPYDRARTLVLSEIDTHLNNDPDGFPMSQWNPGYWLINGKAHPDTPDIDANAGDRVLLRYLSAGPETVTMSMLGMHGHLVARDAYALSDPIDVIAETIPAGSTADMILTVPTGTASGTRLPLYNRQLRLNNGAYGDSQFAPADGGGMLTFVHVP
jgi:FtsP/CotA-like multicopper oxidase with cupredoxin domain